MSFVMLERAMRRCEGSASFSLLSVKVTPVQTPWWLAGLQQGCDPQVLCTPGTDKVAMGSPHLGWR